MGLPAKCMHFVGSPGWRGILTHPRDEQPVQSVPECGGTTLPQEKDLCFALLARVQCAIIKYRADARRMACGAPVAERTK